MNKLLLAVCQILLILFCSPIVLAENSCKSFYTVETANSTMGRKSDTPSHPIKNFSKLLEEKGITNNKLINESDRLYQLAIKLEKENPDKYFVQGYAKVKVEFESSVLYEPFETLSDRLQSTIYLVKAIEVINNLKMFGKSVEFLYFKNAFLNSEWTAAFSALGKANSVVTHFQTSRHMIDWLVYLAFYAKNMPDPIASRFLSTFAASFFEQAEVVSKIFLREGHFSGFSFSADLLPKFSAESTESKSLSNALGELANSFGHENKQKLISSLIIYRNSRSIEILGKLTKFHWFNKQSAEDQLKLFNLINFLSLNAESSQSDIQSNLLRNSLDVILKGDLPVYMKELKKAYGTASPNHISLDNKDEHHQAFGESFSHISLHTITHEISHILSGQRVEASPKYFEEEYRAWYVGFIGENGRRPNKREAAERSAYLLTYYYGNMDEAYGYIAKSFRENPEKFSMYLSGLDLDYISLVNTDYKSFLLKAKEVSTKEEAPIWGCWEGCLSNSPKTSP